LTEMVTNEAIATVLRAESDPAAACKTLVAQANDAGGRDNITAVIVRFDPAS
jgi:PPM family protein phosphatase